MDKSLDPVVGEVIWEHTTKDQVKTTISRTGSEGIYFWKQESTTVGCAPGKHGGIRYNSQTLYFESIDETSENLIIGFEKAKETAYKETRLIAKLTNPY